MKTSGVSCILKFGLLFFWDTLVINLFKDLKDCQICSLLRLKVCVTGSLTLDPYLSGAQILLIEKKNRKFTSLPLSSECTSKREYGR